MLTFSGNTISLQIDDTEMDIDGGITVVPQSRLVIDLEGTVDAVVP
ncbi:MAG: hypothetical protein AAGF11_49500 [Myxococcota bacterium]